jgi:GNAT superfamily N-acetyltransferase
MVGKNKAETTSLLRFRMHHKASSVHQAHDTIATIVRDWFHDPFEAMGYLAVPRQWGTYWNNSQVYVSGLQVSEVGRFVGDLRTYFPDRAEPIYIHIDNPKDDEQLGPAFLEAGCTGPSPEVFLAHVGPSPNDPVRSAIRLVPVSDENLASFADTKLRAWAGNEAEPGREEVQAEIARRKRELADTGRGLLALVDDVPAGFIWWHEEPSLVRWISQLATRVPFRKRGVAATMIRACLETAYLAGCITAVISGILPTRARSGCIANSDL